MSRRSIDLDDLAVEWDCADSWRRSLNRRAALDRARRARRLERVRWVGELVVLAALASALAVVAMVVVPAL